ncbi:hypothetical protein L2E82_49991 [Cichorium intybus]|nr:hypothetical protein L2E82_49991 [Cichorium intybus]
MEVNWHRKALHMMYYADHQGMKISLRGGGGSGDRGGGCGGGGGGGGVKAVEEPAEKQEDMKEDTYFHSSSCGNLNDKLMPLDWESYEKVQKKLLSVYATQLLKKEHSGCHALLRDDKVDDLSRMYRLFSKIPHGLDPVSSIFKQHVAAEGTTLIEQAEDVASNKKAENRDVVGLQEQRHSRGWFKTSLEMLEIFKSYSAKTSLLDDLSFYGNREKMLKAKRISKAAFQTRNKQTRAEHGQRRGIGVEQWRGEAMNNGIYIGGGGCQSVYQGMWFSEGGQIKVLKWL